MSITRSITRALTQPLTRPLTAPGIGGGAVWTPALWFLASEQGIWLDPSDFSTMFQDSVGSTPVTAVEQPVGRILDKSGRGNHASQATSAARPTLSARKNLLTKSEDLSVAPWGFTNATVTPANGANASGAMTLSKVQATTTAAAIIWQSVAGAGSATGNTLRFLARKGSGATDCNSFGVYNVTSTTLLSLFTLNYDTGAITHSVGSGATATSLGNNLWEVKITHTTGITAGNTLQFYGGFVGNAETAGEYAYVGEFQLEASPTATTYQRVNTATDYDTVGFPHYLKFDGVDDSAATAAGGGATTPALIVMRFRTAARGAAHTLFSDRSGNTGLKLEVTAGGNIAFSGGNGASIDTATGAAVAANTDYVVTAKYDGTNLSVQLNRGTATTTACALSAGTAAITLGKDNGAATGFHNGRRYGTVYVKNTAKSAGEIASAEAYMAAKMGVTL